MAPSYLSLADALEDELDEQLPGARVPSEHELARLHGISRLTARAVLDELEARHVVRRSQGRGTFVARRVDYVISHDVPPSWTAAVRAGGVSARSVTESIAVVLEPPGWALESLELTPGEQVLELRRLRMLVEQPALGPVACGTTYLAAPLVPGLGEALARCESLHVALEQTYGLAPARGYLRAELDRMPADAAHRMGLRGRPEAIALSGRTDSRRRGRPIEVTRSWLRADVFRLVMEIGPPHRDT